MIGNTDPLELIHNALLANERLEQLAHTSNLAGYRYAFDDAFSSAVTRSRAYDRTFYTRVVGDRPYRATLRDRLRSEIYAQQRQAGV